MVVSRRRGAALTILRPQTPGMAFQIGMSSLLRNRTLYA